MKLTGLGAVLFTSVAGLMWLVVEDELPQLGNFTAEPGRLAFSTIRKRTQWLDSEFRALNSFIAVREPIFRALAREEICLADACEMLHELAVDLYPRCLRNLRMLEGANLKEKMGRLILVHFRVLVMKGQASTAQVANLEDEFTSSAFRDWCLRTPNW